MRTGARVGDLRSSLERGLNLDGALDGVHDPCKFGTSGINEASVMLLDKRIAQLAM